jgi:hypothetical protein
MNYNPMEEFFKRLGHKIIHTPKASWYEVQHRVLLSFPYYKQVEPTEDELNELMTTNKMLAIRFPTMLDKFGFISNVVVNTNKNYDFASMHQKARNQTRRALENCKVEQIDFDFLYKNGLSLNDDTAKRQGRESQFASPDYWRKYCEAAKNVEGFSAWGSFIDGQLAAFIIAIEVDDWVEWVVNHSATEFRNKYPNNALAFSAAQHFFQNKDCTGICYGLGSLEPTPDLDHFKERMGWRLEPIKQRLVFSNKFRIITELAWEPLLRFIGGIYPESYKVRKTLAMIRHYRSQTIQVPERHEQPSQPENE